MADRAYFVKLNLDDMAASLDALDSTEERGQWLEGFRVGSRGSKPRDGWPEAKMLGYTFGMDCWEKAEEFREKQAAKGRASGESRKRRTGIEPESNHGSTADEPEHQPEANRDGNRDGSSQKPETRNQKPITENEQPHPPTPQGEALPRLAVVEVWNAAVDGTNLPKARATPPRSRLIATRMREPGWIDDFQAAAAFVAKSDFHRGGNDRGWVASIDYLLQAGKATELAEKARTAATTRAPLMRRPGPASTRTAVDQALINQLEEQQHGTEQPLPQFRDTTGELGW